MGDPTGFLSHSREEAPMREPRARLGDFDDLHECLPDVKRVAQASRCMNCGVPYCQSDYGCPLHNLIPDWNDLLYRGEYRQALKLLMKTSSFPEFTGRVCPALCEKACNLSEEGAVTNRDNERFLIEEGFRNGWIQPRAPKARTGKRVAVVGSGPSGLAAADLLNRMGHQVVVYEQADKAGGLLMYGIPNMKLPKGIVERRLELMRREGVRFCLNTRADANTVSAYDAAVLCMGARRARALNAPGADASGVVYAVDYLSETTAALLAGRASQTSAEGRDVIVVGGGDTGNDCVGTCLRQKCRTITQLEMMPAAPLRRAPDNPWPQWPRVIRTDYGQQEAAGVMGHDPRVFETTVKRVLTDENGVMTAIETVRLGRSDTGALKPIEGTERTLPCQLLLIAAGFVGCDEANQTAFDLRLDERGRPTPSEGARVLSPGVFTAGDLRTGQSLVVRAIADGRAAAMEAAQYLSTI